MEKRMSLGNGHDLSLGNGIALEELMQIEESAHRSKTPEAETILRLAAALREAMQVRENAFALMASLKDSVANLKNEKASTSSRMTSPLVREYQFSPNSNF
jgi:hypothetical protein